MSQGLIVRGRIIRDAFSPVGKEHALVIEQGTIKKIGLFEQIKKEFDYPVIGNKNSIVIPGFVNTHSHAVQTLFRGAGDDLELLDWLNQVILPGEASINAGQVYTSSLIGYAEMLFGGITTTNDMATVRHAEQTIKAAIDSGIRGNVGKMLMDRNTIEGLIESTDKAIKEANQLADRYPKGKRVQFAYTPRFLLTCSNELMQRAKEESNKRGLLFHTHAAENISECEEVRKSTGNEYIKAYQDLGILGDKTILAHCVWVSDAEIEIIKETGTTISHNPSSNGKLASGIAPVPKFVQKQIPVGLATDGSPATGGHDMFLEMKLASYYQKAVTHDPKVMDARSVFHLATLEGARALGMEDEIGSIQPGKKADIVILDPVYPNAYPMYNEFSYIVYTATKRDVSYVLVDGKPVVDNRQFHIDLSKQFRLAEEYAREKPWIK